MTEDSIRNIQFNTTDSVYSVKGSSDKPFRKKKQSKKDYTDRKKDIVELSDDIVNDENVEDNSEESVSIIDIQTKTSNIDILVE